MVPSKYQAAINNKLITTLNHLAIDATAGSGKTTTLVGVSKLIPYGKRSLFMAFNKHIVNELKNRLAAGTECSTMHSLGLSAIRKHFPGNVSVNDNKQIQIIMPYFADKGGREKWISIYEIDRVMKLARATMTPATKEGIDELVGNYALDVSEDNCFIAARALGKFYKEDEQAEYNFTCDYQNMIEYCVRNKEIRMPQYDYVLLDEIQDFSKLDQLFINKLVKPITGRKIMVGDPHQSIYSFRGASISSFEDLAGGANTIRLPLSISYRCAKSIVREAKKIYQEIEENPEGEEGIVRIGKVEEIEEGDMVVCRNNRPLIDVFFRLLEQNKKAYIVGKDIEKGLLALTANMTDSMTQEAVIQEFDRLLNVLKERLNKKGISNVDNNPKYIQLQEKIDILSLLFEKMGTVTAVEQWIEETFNDDEREGIRLMTIHKSKGLESERVFFIEKYEDKKLIPSGYAVTADQKIQEKNLQFVAVTRAKKELVYLHL